MDVLTASNLKDALRFDKKLDEISKNNWDKMNRTACGVIRSYLTQDLKYHVMNETLVRKI